MFILKIKEVFLPSAFSKEGLFYDYMDPPYIGFRVEIIHELDWGWEQKTDQKINTDSRFVGLEFTIIEKATEKTAGYFRGHHICIRDEYLTQGLVASSWDEWIKQPKILINNSNDSIVEIYDEE